VLLPLKKRPDLQLWVRTKAHNVEVCGHKNRASCFVFGRSRVQILARGPVTSVTQHRCRHSSLNKSDSWSSYVRRTNDISQLQILHTLSALHSDSTFHSFHLCSKMLHIRIYKAQEIKLHCYTSGWARFSSKERIARYGIRYNGLRLTEPVLWSPSTTITNSTEQRERETFLNSR